MQALREDDTLTELDTLEPKKANMVEALTKALGIDHVCLLVVWHLKADSLQLAQGRPSI